MITTGNMNAQQFELLRQEIRATTGVGVFWTLCFWIVIALVILPALISIQPGMEARAARQQKHGARR